MLIRFAVLVAAFGVMSLIPGIRLKSLGTAVGCAIVFSLLNFFFGFILKALLVVGTLGLAFIALNFLTNMALLWLTDKALKNFEVSSFGSLFMGTLVLTLANVVSTHLAHHPAVYSI